MIGETFRKPKADEGRWWTSNEIIDLLNNRYPSFNPQTVTLQKLGLTMSNQAFGFKSRRLGTGTQYWLAER